jgi:hypothetical protein
MYHIIDTHTGKLVRKFKNSRRAYSYADWKDNEYGACRYIVRPI